MSWAFGFKGVLPALILGAALLGSPARAQDDADVAVAEAPPSSAAEALLTRWVIATGDNNGAPFAVIDKQAGVVSIYSPYGSLLGAAPALVGLSPGDEAMPGIGDRELWNIPPEERTTPAGRFLASYGAAKGAKRVLWVDFQTAISLHAVVTTKPKERRLERLASLEPDDNRITYGCINVSADFYRDVVQPTFDGAYGVVYILPDTKSFDEVFPRVRAWAAAAHDRALASGPADGVRSRETTTTAFVRP